MPEMLESNIAKIAMTTLEKIYQKKITSKLAKELGIKNELEVPRIDKIVVNIGLGEAGKDKKVIQSAKKQLALICGQKPLVTKAGRSIASFNIRQGDPIGLKVTLRKSRMYSFFDKLIKVILPRLRDFQGVKVESFDQNGNYTLGISEQIVFPEIEYDEIDKIRGLEATIVTSTEDKKKAKRLLEMLGMPFEKVEEKSGKERGV